jgi:hypothetical protein
MRVLQVASSGVAGSLILYRGVCVVRLLSVSQSFGEEGGGEGRREKSKQCRGLSKCRCRCAHNRWEGTATPASLTTVVSPESHVSPPRNRHLRNQCGITLRASIRDSSEIFVLVSGECAAHNGMHRTDSPVAFPTTTTCV